MEFLNNIAAPLPGWKPLVFCNTTIGSDGKFTDPCTFESFMELIRIGINNLVILSTFFLVVALVWAGIKLMASGGNPGAMTEAKAMLWKIVLGYIWILAAWIVVYTITSVLLNDGFSLLSKST